MKRQLFSFVLIIFSLVLSFDFFAQEDTLRKTDTTAVLIVPSGETKVSTDTTRTTITPRELNSQYEAAKNTNALRILLSKYKDEVYRELKKNYADSIRKVVEKRHLDSINNPNMRFYIAMERRSDSIIRTNLALFYLPVDSMKPYPKDTILFNELFYPVVVRKNFAYQTTNFNTSRDSLKAKVKHYELPIPENSFQFTFKDSLVQSAIRELVLYYPDHVDFTEEMLPKTILKPVVIKPNNKFEPIAVTPPTIHKTEKIYIELPKVGYWEYKGKLAVQFSQTYTTDNWFQGKNSNVNFYNNLIMTLNYNNRKNTSLNNTLDYKFGFNTTPDDPNQKYRVNNDMLRISSAFGLKAFKKWDYAANMSLSTQLFPVDNLNYKKNPTKEKKYLSNIMSPGYFDFGPGMRYNFETKSKKFRFNFYASPFTYNLRVVLDSANVQVTRHGVPAGKRKYESFGVTIQLDNIYWQISRDISYSGRFKYYSPFFKNVQAEFESNINMYVNRFFSTTLNCYFRYDDARKKREGEKTYIQFKELFSFGMNFWW